MVRDQIISAAVQIFSRHGFDAAGMDEIAQAAGVAKGSLYYNFRSKSDLFAAVVSEGIDDLHRQIERILSRSDTVRQVLDGLVRENLKACQDYPELVDLIMRDQSGGLDAAAASRVREAREAYVRYIAGLLENGMREGLLRRGDPLSLAGAYLAFLHALSKAGRMRGRSLSDLVAEAADLIMNGLCRP
ncbi:MAG: TetR/AcrR family transcriptional regulator [Clostridiaceae bacterium]|jgi:AcrR family transcriptional regulator|nr:TetR/AcrR family transcriptional regulator [Clostridiales bacterium]MDD2441085.1 TetR/AcrR family transcriptional regulator [Eubacteriales bacterium]MDD4139408.1 TetR/AcrR family transcriptional regulator [Eubacteriales bacterium]MDD4743782.1 TetR/AcrR family transcriptional regulator [Eubacteriales bacterium]NLB45950.1 TetR/AcrR family transcriptional regulator [Clostridiaceae bacterium]